MSGYWAQFRARKFAHTFFTIKRERLTSFQSALNSVFPDIQFTMKEDKVQKLPFPDVLIHRHVEGEYLTSVYRKTINTARFCALQLNHLVTRTAVPQNRRGMKNEGVQMSYVTTEMSPISYEDVPKTTPHGNFSPGGMI